MKKVISILLVLVMCFTMSTVAFAADETTEDVSKDGIIAILLEAAKLASSLNDEAREGLSEELEKLLIGQIAGDNAFLQGAAEWILDKILGLSGADNILDIDKTQAENIADLLMQMYNGNLADAIDSPILKIVVNLIPEEFMKEAVVWVLSDGFGDALKDFINKYEGGEGSEEVKPETPDKEEEDNGGELDAMTAIAAAFQAIKDVFNELVEMIKGFFNGLATA